MSQDTVLTVAPDALDMILQLRDQEPGEGEFALSIEVTGFRGPQFSYELAFVPLADKADNWVEERHDDLAVIFPKADTGKLEGAALELTEQGLAEQDLDAGPGQREPDGGAEQSGPDDEDRAGDRGRLGAAHQPASGVPSSGTDRTRVRSRRSPAAPCR